MDKLNQLIRQKKYRAASNLLRKMVEQAPEDGYLLTRMADSLWDDRKNEEAIAEWDNILNMSEHDLKESGYRPMWIKTFVNDAR